MTMRPRWHFVAVSIALLIGVVLVLHNAASVYPPQRHADGAGPLASRDGPGHEMLAVDPARDTTSWTYGMRLCLTNGSTEATIESVGPTRSVGDGFRQLGAVIRQFTPSPMDTPIIGVAGYPPPSSFVPDTMSAVRGFEVRTPCADAEPDAPYTELLVGLGIVNEVGGGWDGVDVHYTSQGRAFVLSVQRQLFICGTAIEAKCA